LGCFTCGFALQCFELSFVFLFLPLAPWIGNGLLGMVYFVWWLEPLRIVVLALLGCLFSLLLVMMLLKLGGGEKG
jgi:hypothetical protein